MADYSYSGYKDSGFYTAAGIEALQKHLSDYYNRTEEQLRADAKAAYDVQYDANKLNYQNQLDQLGIYRNADLKKINSQYDRAGNTIDNDLTKRGLGRSSLVSTRGVENENARNAAIADKSLEYLEQENKINADRQALDAEYAQNVENEFVKLRDKQLADRINMLTTIASLQQNGYSNYVNYLLNK